MTEQQMTIDPEHPWAEASMYGSPSPIPTNVKLDAVTLSQEGEEPVEACLATFVTPVGVFTFFMPPAALNNVVMMGAQILQDWREEQSGGLVVANQSQMKQAVADAQAAEKMFRK